MARGGGDRIRVILGTSGAMSLKDIGPGSPKEGGGREGVDKGGKGNLA